MKLNHDCVRDLLLSIEEQKIIEYHNLETLLLIERLNVYSKEDIFYTTELLTERGLLDARVSTYRLPSNDSEFLDIKFTSDYDFWIEIRRMTWEGHEFLDNIRDNTVWKQTKEVSSKFSSVSISILSDVASNIISQTISKHLGF